MNNKPIALITGATSGIGAEYARRLAADEYNLIVTGRRKEKIKALADELAQSYDSDVEVIIIELSDSIQVDEFIESIKDRDVDLLINNAGFGTSRSFHNEPLQLQEDMVATNIICAMKLTYAVLPKMLKKRSGTIINVSSVGAFISTPNEATYVGTKAFLRAFSEALYFELIGTGVKVQVVCPGLTKTDMPIRLGVPEDQIVDRGPFKWITPQEVVAGSMRCLKKNKVVCFPGQLNKMQVLIRHITPDALYYKSINYFFRKYGWTDGA